MPDEQAAPFRIVYPQRSRCPVLIGWLSAAAVPAVAIALSLLWYSRQYCSSDFCPRNEDPPFLVAMILFLVVFVAPVAAIVGWSAWRVARAYEKPLHPHIEEGS